jgi:DnaJ-class molecular chaperone
MKTPYQILDVQPEASDVEIKQAYLQQVKLNPPDRDQQQFQLIHQAYLSIKDLKSRLSDQLFNAPELNFNKVIGQALHTTAITEISAKQFNTLFQASIDDSTIQNALSPVEK